MKRALPDHDTWQLIDTAVADALELPANQREAFLHQKLAARPDVLAAAKELVSFDTGSQKLFEKPVLATWQWAEQGASLGPWKLIRQLGAGGMGVVWLARRVDGEADMLAAIKLLPQSLGGTSELRSRFLREKQILARLQHPNIARLLEASTGPATVPNFVMEYVEGRPLVEFAAGLPDVPARLRLFLKVCDAIQHAHANLIVHRDLKPQNILVDAAGEPKVLDFGIAKIISDAGSDGAVTMHRAFSLDYASPEQIRGVPAGIASDIYSLGLVLYEVLSGERARQWKDKPLDLMIADANRFVPAAHERIGGDLLAVIRKAAHPDPESRYGTVAALAEDLSRVLAGRPVLASAPSALRRASLFLRRNWMSAAAVSAIAATIAGLAVQSWISARQAREALALAQRSQAEAVRERETAIRERETALRERARAEDQSRKLAVSLDAEQRQTERARAMESNANAQRAQAERNLIELLSVFGRITQSTREDVSRLPGGPAAAIRLIETAVARLEKLQPSPATRLSYLYLLGEANAQLAELYGGANASLGDNARAEQYRVRARGIWESGHREFPNDAGFHSRWLLASFNGDRERRAAWNDDVFKQWEAKFLAVESAAGSNRRDVLLDIARFYFSGGANNPANTASRVYAFERSLELFRRIHAMQNEQTRLDDLRNIALPLKYLAGLNNVPREKRRQYAEEAVTLDRERVRMEPSSSTSRMDLAFSLGALGDQHATANDAAGAIALYRESAAIRRETASIDPNNSFALRSQFYPVLAWAYWGRATASAMELQAAIDAFDQAARLAKPPATADQLGQMRYYRGELASLKGDQAAACEHFRAADRQIGSQSIRRPELVNALARCGKGSAPPAAQ